MFRFSLRTLLLCVSLASIYAWFVSYAIEGRDPVFLIVFFVLGPAIGGLAGLVRETGRAVLIGLAIGAIIPVILWLLAPTVY